MFKVDSHRVLEWANLITTIHNDMAKGKNFKAGFSLCFLQQCMFEIYKDLDKQEKSQGPAGGYL